MDPPNSVRKQTTPLGEHTVTFTPASMSKEDKEHLREIAFEAVKTVCAEKIPILGEVELRSLLWGHDSDSDPEVIAKSDNETDGSGRDLADTYGDSVVETDAGLSASVSDAGTDQASFIDTDQMSVLEGDQMSVFEAEEVPVVNEETESSGEEEESSSEDHAPHERSQNLNMSHPLLQLIKELKITATIVRTNAVADWKHRMNGKVLKLKPVPEGNVSSSASSEEGEPKTEKPGGGPYKKACPFEGCDSLVVDHPQALRRHLLTHYPYALFCPICYRSIVREDSLGRHFRSNNCLLAMKGMRIPIIRHPDGRVTINMSYNYLNIYHLGAMENDVMPDSHFELIARRKRHAPISES